MDRQQPIKELTAAEARLDSADSLFTEQQPDIPVDPANIDKEFSGTTNTAQKTQRFLRLRKALAVGTVSAIALVASPSEVAHAEVAVEAGCIQWDSASDNQEVQNVAREAFGIGIVQVLRLGKQQGIDFGRFPASGQLCLQATPGAVANQETSAPQATPPPTNAAPTAVSADRTAKTVDTFVDADSVCANTYGSSFPALSAFIMSHGASVGDVGYLFSALAGVKLSSPKAASTNYRICVDSSREVAVFSNNDAALEAALTPIQTLPTGDTITRQTTPYEVHPSPVFDSAPQAPTGKVDPANILQPWSERTRTPIDVRVTATQSTKTTTSRKNPCADLPVTF